MSTAHNASPEKTCGFDNCPRCRPAQTREQALLQARAEHKRRLAAGEWVDTNSYTPEEHLTNQRVAGARRYQRETRPDRRVGH